MVRRDKSRRLRNCTSADKHQGSKDGVKGETAKKNYVLMYYETARP